MVAIVNLGGPVSASHRLAHEGAALGQIHAGSNANKASDHWHGFLRGLLASGTIDDAEMEAMRAEAKGMAEITGCEVAEDFVRDVDAEIRGGGRDAHRIVSAYLVRPAIDNPGGDLKRRVN
ncbi:hypothetical protein [Aurantimonas sp. 22II-16-19i]|uniref:hypothetical protein n=1 Tax=Aurantimonas sp. 22II-16-19i TaxID=1317114 RepID=UPI0009F7D59A|nr:hypothetical protein [Aurantimonas sp. 22II-16-19i]ORE97766.1 superfamily I DNA and RNA helicases and helicasesubunits-like protein [Aurantimonas sp. 22II-16-19i]